MSTTTDTRAGTAALGVLTALASRHVKPLNAVSRLMAP